MTLRDIMNLEKANMNKIRYIVNYRVLPIFGIVTVALLVTVSILMTIDEDKYTPAAIAIFVFLGVLMVGVLISVPYTRRAELAIEMKRYDFDVSNLYPRQVYDFFYGTLSLRFDKNGMYVNGVLFWYNHSKMFINTSNKLNRIWITLVLYIDESCCFELLLDRDVLSMIKEFGIPLSNQATLDYIINHKEEAFKKIYNKGHV